MPFVSLLLVLALAACTSPAVPAWSSPGPCERTDAPDGHVRLCEARTVQLDRRDLRLDAGHTGGIEVRAWDGDTVELTAVITADGRTEAEARRRLGEVRIETGETVRAIVPDEDGESWVQVDYHVSVPRDAALELDATNGPISVDDVRGPVRAHAVNGPVRLLQTGADVDARTVNGPVEVVVDARGGRGVRVRSVNGRAEVAVPAGFDGDVEARSTMGRVQTQGLGLPAADCASSPCLGGSLTGRLGQGGTPLRVDVTNGAVLLRRR